MVRVLWVFVSLFDFSSQWARSKLLKIFQHICERIKSFLEYLLLFTCWNCAASRQQSCTSSITLYKGYESLPLEALSYHKNCDCNRASIEVGWWWYLESDFMYSICQSPSINECYSSDELHLHFIIFLNHSTVLPSTLIYLHSCYSSISSLSERHSRYHTSISIHLPICLSFHILGNLKTYNGCWILAKSPASDTSSLSVV